MSLQMLSIDPPLPAVPPDRTIVEMVRDAARRDPGAAALVCGGTRLSWAAFDARINRAAQLLISLGVGPGDRVAILSPNSVPFAELFMGILRAGACVVPLSSMASGEALRTMLQDCGARVFFLAEALRDLAAPCLGLPGIRQVALDFTGPGFAPYENLMADAPEADPETPVAVGDPCNLIYSSGTTGTPKGILHDHAMRAAQMERVTPNGYDDNARTLLSTPLYSNTTIVSFLPTLVGGSTVHLMAKFDAREWLEIVQAERITHTMLVPVQIARILAVPDVDRFDLSSLRVIFSTSAPLRADAKQAALMRFSGRLVEYYGLTEGGGVTVLESRAHPDKLHTVGQPTPGCDIRLVGEDGAEVAPGETGEICGRSPTMMAGYFNRDDLTEAMLWRGSDGAVYFRSGDMGRFDADGFLILSDRKKDMIVSGGLNVYATDLELALMADRDVADAAVIGVPSQAWGETPLGLVVLKDGAQARAEDICRRANARLGKAQRLSAVEIRTTLPRSAIGKVLKRDLRAPYWETET